MATYHPPVRDMQFVLHELLDAETVFSTLPGFEDASADLINSVIEASKGALRRKTTELPANHTPTET